MVKELHRQRIANYHQRCPRKFRNVYHHHDDLRRLQLGDQLDSIGTRKRSNRDLQPELDRRAGRGNFHHDG